MDKTRTAFLHWLNTRQRWWIKRKGRYQMKSVRQPSPHRQINCRIVHEAMLKSTTTGNWRQSAKDITPSKSKFLYKLADFVPPPHLKLSDSPSIVYTSILPLPMNYMPEEATLSVTCSLHSSCEQFLSILGRNFISTLLSSNTVLLLANEIFFVLTCGCAGMNSDDVIKFLMLNWLLNRQYCEPL